MSLVYAREILGRLTELIRVARLQNEVGSTYFFRGTDLLTKNAQKFSPKF